VQIGRAGSLQRRTPEGPSQETCEDETVNGILKGGKSSAGMELGWTSGGPEVLTSALYEDADALGT